MTKRVKYYGKSVIGVDESNNGFQEKGIPMVIAAYLIKDYQRSFPSNEPFERKILAYSNQQRDKFVNRSKEFLRRNPLFCYTVITEQQFEQYGLICWSNALASVITGIIDFYSLPKDLVILPHRIDDKSRTQFIGKNLIDLLNIAGIKYEIQFRGDEDKNRAIRKADRVAYNISGLKLLSKSKKWPCRDKKVRFDFIDDFLCNKLRDDIELDHSRLSQK